MPSQNKNDLLGRFYFGSEAFESPKFCVSKTYRGFGVARAEKLACSFFKQAEEALADTPHPQQRY